MTFPVWVNADVASLFSVSNNFTARLEVESTNEQGVRHVVNGRLSGLDGNLLFIPEAGKGRRGPFGAGGGGLSFLWNTRSNAAFVLCEPMQAYALANSGSASSTRETAAQEAELIDGQRCQRAVVTCLAASASTNIYTVWRATDLNNLPLKIEGNIGQSTWSLTLSKASLQSPASDQFVVPDGFTRYENMKAMLAELLEREGSMRRRGMGGEPPHMYGGPGGGPPPGRDPRQNGNF